MSTCPKVCAAPKAIFIAARWRNLYCHGVLCRCSRWWLRSQGGLAGWCAGKSALTTDQPAINESINTNENIIGAQNNLPARCLLILSASAVTPKHFRVERLVHAHGVAGRKLTNTIERTFFMTETCADERSSRPGLSQIFGDSCAA